MSARRDLVIIGGGPGGLVVASVASQLGLKVTLVEKSGRLGGDCLHSGCVPSKTLIRSARVAHLMRTADRYGLPGCDPDIDMGAVIDRVNAVIAEIQVHDDPERFRGYGCDVIFGAARFTGPNDIEVGEERIRGKRFVIATGSLPVIPPIPGLEEAGYVNFGLAAAGFAYMMATQPAYTLDDLKGRKVWAPEGDPVGFAALRALGVAPVVMPVTDVMTGLQTDLLDSITAPPVGAVVFQWHTQLNYLADVPIAYVYAALLVEKRVFSRLTPEDQAVVREVMEGIYRKFDKYGVSDNQEAMQALLASGLESITPDPEDVAEWREVVRQSHRQLAAEDVFDPVLYDRIESLLEQYRAGQ